MTTKTSTQVEEQRQKKLDYAREQDILIKFQYVGAEEDDRYIVLFHRPANGKVIELCGYHKHPPNPDSRSYGGFEPKMFEGFDNLDLFTKQVKRNQPDHVVGDKTIWDCLVAPIWIDLSHEYFEVMHRISPYDRTDQNKKELAPLENLSEVLFNEGIVLLRAEIPIELNGFGGNFSNSEYWAGRLWNLAHIRALEDVQISDIKRLKKLEKTTLDGIASEVFRLGVRNTRINQALKEAYANWREFYGRLRYGNRR